MADLFNQSIVTPVMMERTRRMVGFGNWQVRATITQEIDFARLHAINGLISFFTVFEIVNLVQHQSYMENLPMLSLKTSMS